MVRPKFCEQCGTPLSDATKFCTSCGWKIPEEESSPINTENVESQTVEPVSDTTAPQPQESQPQKQEPQQSGPQSAEPQYQQPVYSQPQNAQPQYQQPQYNQAQYYQQPKRTNPVPFIIIAIIVALVGIAGAIYLLKDRIPFLKSGSSVKLEQLTGDWEGYYTPTKVFDVKDEELKKQIEESGGLNKKLEATMNLQMESKDSGMVIFVLEGDEETTKSVSYSNGTLKMSFDIPDDDQTATFTGSVKKSDGKINLSGTFVITYNGKCKVSGKLELSKPLDDSEVSSVSSSSSSIKFEQLSGDWEGSFILTKIDVDDEEKRKELEDEGLNKKLEAAMNLEMDSKDNGTANLSLDGGERTSKSVSFSDGTLKIKFDLDEKNTSTFTGVVKKIDGKLNITGTIIMTQEGVGKLTGKLELTKSSDDSKTSSKTSTSPSIKYSDLSGDWSGTINLSSVDGIETSQDSGNIDSILNKELEASLKVDMSSETSGHSSLSMMDSMSEGDKATYSDGKLNLIIEDSDAITTLEGIPQKSGDGYAISGTIVVELIDSGAKVKGTWKMTKE